MRGYHREATGSNTEEILTGIQPQWGYEAAEAAGYKAA